MVDSALGTTNVLLATLVVISVLEAVALAIVVVGAVRLYAKILRAVRDVQREIQPLAARADDLAARVERIATDLEATTARAASGAASASAAFRAAVDVAKLVRGTTTRSVVSRALPLLGLARGLREGYRVFVGKREPRPPRRLSRFRNDHEDRGHPDANTATAANHNTEAIHGT
jgi:hypothetical protein